MKRRIALRTILLACGLSCVQNISAQAHQYVKDSYDFSPLNTILQSWVDSGYYKGSAILICNEKDEVLFSKTYGNYTLNTPVYVASAGKWIATATIASVVDRTSLRWDSKIKDYLPEFSDARGEIRLRQLLSHTSGILPYLPEPDIDTLSSLALSVKGILPLPVNFPAGTRFEYGGLAMQIAGYMAELATGKDFEQLFQENICRPLGMTHSHFIPVNTEGGHAPMLGGGLQTTAHDYIRFLEMIYHQGHFRGTVVLQPETVTEMQADQIGNASLSAGEFVERAWGQTHTGIYGLGEWRELIDAQRKAYQISSPGWAGTYPWINTHDKIYGFYISHITGFEEAQKDKYSSFYDLPIIAQITSLILARNRKDKPQK